MENMEERERSSRPRGVPNAEKLKEAKEKYKTFEAAKEEYKQLRDINAKKTLTPKVMQSSMLAGYTASVY